MGVKVGGSLKTEGASGVMGEHGGVAAVEVGVGLSGVSGGFIGDEGGVVTGEVELAVTEDSIIRNPITEGNGFARTQVGDDVRGVFFSARALG